MCVVLVCVCVCLRERERERERVRQKGGNVGTFVIVVSYLLPKYKLLLHILGSGTYFPSMLNHTDNN